MEFVKRSIAILKKFLFSSTTWIFILTIFLGIICKFRFPLLVLNLAVATILIVIISLLSNRLTFAIFTTFLIAFLMQLANVIKKRLLSTSLEVTDFAWLTNFRKLNYLDFVNLYITQGTIIFAAVLICAIFIFWHFSNTIISISTIKLSEFILLRLLSIATGVSLISLMTYVLSIESYRIHGFLQRTYEPILQKMQPKAHYITFWEEGFSRRFGPFAAFVLGWPRAILKPKPVYATEQIITEAIKHTHYPSVVSTSALPDIVMILNESTFNPSLLDYEFAHKLVFKLFEQDQYTKFRGAFNVNTFGGSSWISEFEIITGMPLDLFTGPKFPFLITVHFTKKSIMWALRDLGYMVTIIYPVKKTFAGGSTAYPKLGAHEIIDIHDFGHIPASWRDVPDSLVAQMIINVLEKNKGKPNFIFAATISNHGPHSTNHPDKISCSNVLEGELCSKMNDYIEKLGNTNRDILDLNNKLMHRSNRTVLINFGDHLPAFEGYTQKLKFRKDSHIKDIFTTFYDIRANFEISADTQQENYDALDITFMPGLILDIVGYHSENLYKANSFMRKLCRGQIQNCKTDYYELTESYKDLIIKESTGRLFD